MCNITQDRTIDLANALKDCGCDGNEYRYVQTCTECNGAKKFKKGNRNYKCKSCSGYGWTRLEAPILLGTCKKCNGSQKVPMTMYDCATEEDKQWIFNNLFNFDKPYTGQSNSFNEQYLGLGTYAGCTDYGRYRSMSPEEFKVEVEESFTRGYNQYVALTHKGKLPTEVLIRKSSSGWTAYPIYES